MGDSIGKINSILKKTFPIIELLMRLTKTKKESQGIKKSKIAFRKN